MEKQYTLKGREYTLSEIRTKFRNVNKCVTIPIIKKSQIKLKELKVGMVYNYTSSDIHGMRNATISTDYRGLIVALMDRTKRKHTFGTVKDLKDFL